MKRKNLLSLATAIALLSTNIYAIQTPAKKVSVSKKYENGWWWYEEKYQDPKTKKEEVIKYKISPQEKAKIDREENTNKLLKLLIVEQKENKNLNKKILKRLNYAFPNTTPIYSKDSKGNKCLTNSSADCFIMPVVAEGQHVPVLKKFLRNPSPKNSTEWLKWQAKYFNHVSKVSHGLRFAFLNGGSDVYSTSTDYTYGDNMIFSQSEAAQGAREAKIIHSMKDKLAYLIFLGQNMTYEKVVNAYDKFRNYNKTFMKDMNFVIVFPSKEAERKILKEIIPAKKRQGYVNIFEFFDKAKKAVRPDLYKKYNIRITPSIVLFYENEKNKKKISQTLLSGKLSVKALRKATMNFLKYNDIIKPGEMGADKNWNTPETPVNKSLTNIPKPKKAVDFNEEDKRLEELEKADKEQ